jgi:hypothetical protein
MGTTHGHRRPSEAEFYWRAAQDALQPLDWTIDYVPGARRWERSISSVRKEPAPIPALTDRRIRKPVPSDKTRMDWR